MKYTNLSFVYGIGKQARTREYSIYQSEFLIPLQKQLSLSFPLITSITLQKEEEHLKKELFSIYVGKEITLNRLNDYYIQKYDIDEDELERFRDAGYERVCLLSYKKYDLVLVGLKKQDKVVSDYFALKRNLLRLEKLHKQKLQSLR